MRIGISVTSSWPGVEPARAAAIMIERTAAAYEAGVATLSVGDHHVEAQPYVQNTPILGRMLAEWPDREAGCLFLLPLWNPVLVAEQVGTLSAMVDAPFVVQVGLGRGARQFDAMGSQLSTRGADTNEAIRVVTGLLAGDTVSSERYGIVDASFGLTASQQVHWWIGGHAPAGLDRAARLGDAWYAGPGLSNNELGQMAQTYRELCVRYAKPHRAIVRQDVLVLDDADRAHHMAHKILKAGYRAMTEDQVLVGGREAVRARLQELENLGFDSLVFRCMSADQAVALESIEIMGSFSSTLAG